MAIERLTVEEIKSSIIQKLERNYGCEISDATIDQLYDALAQTVKDEVMKRRTASRGERKRRKQYVQQAFYGICVHIRKNPPDDGASFGSGDLL